MYIYIHFPHHSLSPVRASDEPEKPRATPIQMLQLQTKAKKWTMLFQSASDTLPSVEWSGFANLTFIELSKLFHLKLQDPGSSPTLHLSQGFPSSSAFLSWPSLGIWVLSEYSLSVTEFPNQGSNLSRLGSVYEVQTSPEMWSVPFAHSPAAMNLSDLQGRSQSSRKP